MHWNFITHPQDSKLTLETWIMNLGFEAKHQHLNNILRIPMIWRRGFVKKWELIWYNHDPNFERRIQKMNGDSWIILKIFRAQTEDLKNTLRIQITDSGLESPTEDQDPMDWRFVAHNVDRNNTLSIRIEHSSRFEMDESVMGRYNIVVGPLFNLLKKTFSKWKPNQITKFMTKIVKKKKPRGVDARSEYSVEIRSDKIFLVIFQWLQLLYRLIIILNLCINENIMHHPIYYNGNL